MKCRHWSGSIEEKTIAECVEYEVAGQQSERGLIEDLQLKVEKLTDLIGVLAGFLSEAQQKELGRTLYYYKPVK